MSEQDIFIGREKELQMIDEMIFDPAGANHVLPIVGEGGFGKTWLLRKVYQRYHQDPRVVVVQVDFSNVRAQSMPGLSLYFLGQFGDNIPEEQNLEYRTRLSDMPRLMDLETDADKARKIEDRTYEFGIGLIKKVSKVKRILVIGDTLEAVKSLEHAKHMHFLHATFQNTVLILAGRPAENVRKLYEEFQGIYGGNKWVVHDVYRLKPFSTKDTADYFDEVLPQKVDPELSEKISLLTDGNPVLVTIAGEWLKRNVSLPKDIDLPLEKLKVLGKSALIEKQKEFERGLIDRVRTLRRRIDWAVLYLAHLNRRYDPKILRLVMGIASEEELNEITQELETLVFVRKSMSSGGGLLHDEAQQLIMKYAWQSADPDGELRKHLTQTVIDGYYLPEIERLRRVIQEKLIQSVEKMESADCGNLPLMPEEDLLKRELQMECLYYHFLVSEEVGKAYLEELLGEALTYQYSRVQMDAIVQTIHNIAPDQTDSVQFKSRVAQTMLAKGERASATEMAKAVLESPEIASSDAVRALIVLGNTATDPVETIKHFEDALERARLVRDNMLEAEALWNLGLAYRRQGRWPEAEETYKQVLRLLDEKQDAALYADILNNLAFVYMLNGNLTRADSMAEKALRIRKELGNFRGLSFGYATKGRIAEAMGDYAQAVRYHRTAVDLANSVEDSDNAALMQVNVAAAECRAHNFESARKLLSPALKNEQPPHIHARALHQAAKTDLEEASSLVSQNAPASEIETKYESAETNAQQALELAQKIGDDHMLAGVLLDFARIAFLKDRREDTEHLDALRDILETHDYKLERGQLSGLMGDIAYSRSDIPAAFEHYLDACDTLAAYSPAGFREAFERTRDRFLDTAPELQTDICRMIEERFATVHSASPLTALKELCENEF